MRKAKALLVRVCCSKGVRHLGLGKDSKAGRGVRKFNSGEKIRYALIGGCWWGGGAVSRLTRCGPSYLIG